jgi:putative endonuclease
MARTPRHLRSGRTAERRARAYLRRHGLSFIDQNYRTPRGEIDLVMQDGDTLVFVEVRYRRSEAYGLAGETVDRSKQQKLRLSAEYYLQQYFGPRPRPCRFDVVAIAGDSRNGNIVWYRNAF